MCNNIVKNVYFCSKGKVKLNRYSKRTLWAGILIVIYPILAPYKLLGISVNWLLGGLFVLVHLLNHASFPIMSKLKPLVIYTVVSFILSLNGFFILSNPANLLNAEIAMIVNMVIYMVLWYCSDIDVTMKFGNFIGYVCCMYSLIQILATISGRIVPIGQLPLLEVSTGWVTDVWGFRFNSLFSEPSYFAIYLLPLFVYNLLNGKWLKSIIFGFFIVLSSSSLGIISLIIIIVMRFISGKFSLKSKIKFLLILLSSIAFAGIIVNNIPTIGVFIRRSYGKISDIFGNSSANGGYMEDIRLGGYLNLFSDLPIKEQIFGVGNAQLQNYFAEQGLHVFNYSNSFVLSLLNFGVVGFLVFIFFLYYLFRVSRKGNTLKEFF